MKQAGAIAGAALKLAIAFVFAAPFVGAFLYKIMPPPGTWTMLERKMSGEVIIHPWTPIEKISPALVRAVIAAEDSRFCKHRGIDYEAVQKAAEQNAKGGKRRGGSTISQQTAKNVFLWTGGGYLRKAFEAWFAIVSDAIWGKRRTGEIYLNVAEGGDGRFGAEAAAQALFRKPASQLTKDEAARLAAILPSPNKWRAVNPGPYVRYRSGVIRKRMDIVRRDGLDQCVLGTGK